MNRTLASCTALCLMIGFSSQTMAQTAEPATAEPVSSTTQAPQLTPIDYTVVKTFMDKFSVVERGRPKLNYDHVRDVGKPFLTAYINYLGEQNLDGRSEDEQLAHWLNVQNFLVIQAITEDTKKSNLK